MIVSGPCVFSKIAAIRPMAGAESRPSGSPTMFAGGTSGSCARTGVGMAGIGDDIQPLRRDQIAHPVGRLLKHRALADDVEKLLGRVLPAARPQAGSAASGGNDDGNAGLGIGIEIGLGQNWFLACFPGCSCGPECTKSPRPLSMACS